MPTDRFTPIDRPARIAPPAPSREKPKQDCDVVMKGGITSGVIYPWALVEFANTFRLRGIGGASAGAIGAAFGAAGEFGRTRGGFEILQKLPLELGEGKLAELFRAESSTEPLLPIMISATGHDRPGGGRSGPMRVVAVAGAAVRGFPLASVIGIAPGVALIVVGAGVGGSAGLLLIVSGVPLAAIGWLVAISARVIAKLTRAVPENLFGICRGHSSDDQSGLTDWLANKIDAAACLDASERPLTFGHLWTGRRDLRSPESAASTVTGEAPAAPPPPGSIGAADREIDLRMVSTCLTQGRPYEMPWESRMFFYDPAVWETLFPRNVMAALAAAKPEYQSAGSDDPERTLEDQAARRHNPPLVRLPDAADLPVIVATRLSLSFPLLISAVPIYSVRHEGQQITFDAEWFSDGGLCSNFPIYMFDSPLPTRPTFAINLDMFPDGKTADVDQRNNVVLATTNESGSEASYRPLPTRGAKAISGFAAAALNTARNWSDNAQLRYPGYRDRIVRVNQSSNEGGLNLYMDTESIKDLADRGTTAARTLVTRFTQPSYSARGGGDPDITGWDNHRGIRIRALVASLPAFLKAYQKGRRALTNPPPVPNEYALSGRAQEVAENVLRGLDTAADTLSAADETTLKELRRQPLPLGILRRTPQI